jgi:hypothetical protein
MANIHKVDVVIGEVYRIRHSSGFTDVKITQVCSYGGWYATNLTSGREIRIKSAAKLRRVVTVDELKRRAERAWRKLGSITD